MRWPFSVAEPVATWPTAPITSTGWQLQRSHGWALSEERGRD
jgi:hypothetical protein